MGVESVAAHGSNGRTGILRELDTAWRLWMRFWHQRASTTMTTTDAHNTTKCAEEDGGAKPELKSQMKAQYENNTYEFNLQGLDFSLDSLLLLVVCSLVWLAGSVLDEGNSRGRGNPGGRVYFSGGVHAATRRLRFLDLRILSRSCFSFVGGSHGCDT